MDTHHLCYRDKVGIELWREAVLNEVWMPIPGYKGSYEASSWGRVRSLERVIRKSNNSTQTVKPKILRIQINRDRRQQVQLTVKSHSFNERVHRLVMLAFVGRMPPGLETRHLDDDCTNNRIYNLHYGTKAENSQDAILNGKTPQGEKQGSSKLTQAQVTQIWSRRHDVTNIELARYFSVTEGAIRLIIKGRNWGWLTSTLDRLEPNG